jgi:hypothetical protein
MSPDQFEQEWLECSPFLERALEHDGIHAWTLDDVRREIDQGRAHFWRWPADPYAEATAAAVTHFVTYPRFRALNYWLLGGDLQSIRAMLPLVEDWALTQGCTRFMGEGRPGFARAFAKDGYRAVSTTYLKQISLERLQ